MVGTDIATREPIEGEILPSGGNVPVSLPAQEEFRRMEAWAKTLANSGILPKHLSGRHQAVMTVMLYGRELRLPPMEAIANIYVIDQRPCLAAHLQRAIILRAGHQIYCVASDASKATFAGRRLLANGEYGEPQEVTWRIEQAKTANLDGKTNWKLYPDAMLRARASSALARLMFPDVLMGGVYTPEEMGAQVDAKEGVVKLPEGATAERARKATDTADQQALQFRQIREGETPTIIDPAAPLDLPPVEDIATEPVPDAPPPAHDRTALWGELIEQARVMGKTVHQYTARWAAAHHNDITMASNSQLAQFVAERRDQVATYASDNPGACDEAYTGPDEDLTVPPDPHEETE